MLHISVYRDDIADETWRCDGHRWEARLRRLIPSSSARRKARMFEAKRRARHTAHEKQALLEFTGGRCVKCWRPTPAERLQWDHIAPVSMQHLSPSDGIGNLQPLCAPCNYSKGARGDTEDFRSDGWREYVTARAPIIERDRRRARRMSGRV